MSPRPSRHEWDEEAAPLAEHDYWRSYSDLLIGLVLIFILLIPVMIIAKKDEMSKSKIRRKGSDILEELKALENSVAGPQKLKEEIAALRVEIARLEKEKREEVERLKAEIDRLKSDLGQTDQQKQEEIRRLKAEIDRIEAEKKAEIDRLNELIALKERERQEEITRLKAEFEKTEREMKDEIARLLAEVGRLTPKSGSAEAELKRVIGESVRLRRDIIQRVVGRNRNLTIDQSTGSLKFEEGVLFDTDRATLLPRGEETLKMVIPQYVASLLGDDTDAASISQVIIEGHTDTRGSYWHNLKLSQERSLAVASFILGQKMPDFIGKKRLLHKLTVNGCSWSRPMSSQSTYPVELNEAMMETRRFDVFYTGSQEIDLDRSRRVEIKFTIKEDELIKAYAKAIYGAP